ncbi:MAG: leucine-rich repeat protein [Paludibacteraceae bacterium]|nr:leucine-rich repeat protein [Paludibacteraceae bacterium]
MKTIIFLFSLLLTISCDAESLYFKGFVFDTINNNAVIKKLDTLYFYENNISNCVIPPSVISKGTEFQVKKIHRITPCSFIKRIYIPKTVEKISSIAFNDCGVEEVIIDAATKRIQSGTFYNCKKLRKVIISDSVKIIQQNAFSNCISLKEIIFSDNTEKIEGGAFAQCENLESLNLPHKLKSLDLNSFWHCSNLKTIVAGDSLREVEGICEVEQLQAFIIPSSNNYLKEKDGVIYSKNFEKLFLYLPSLKNKEYKVQKETKVIGYGAFAGSKYLEIVYLSNNTTLIEDNAFRSCKKLYKVRFPDRESTIGKNSFFLCDSLKEVTLKKGSIFISNTFLDNTFDSDVRIIYR